MRVVLIVLFSLGLTWGGCSDVFAMLTIETDGVRLHFPEGEKAIAARLNHNLADIMIYLQKMGLPVKRPLHIVVDENRDEPDVQVHVIPHLEIRIPLRAPGVLEEGYTEADPRTSKLSVTTRKSGPAILPTVYTGNPLSPGSIRNTAG